MRCDHCGHEVPFGVFCTRCGAHQGRTREFGDPRTRLHRYAAHPSEHVFQPVVFTTLYPHLGHDKVYEFRWAFVIGVGAIVLLFATGLIIAAILVSALLLPLLFLVYFYEAQVYRDDPARVIALTLGVTAMALESIGDSVLVRLSYPSCSTQLETGGCTC